MLKLKKRSLFWFRYFFNQTPPGMRKQTLNKSLSGKRYNKHQCFSTEVSSVLLEVFFCSFHLSFCLYEICTFLSGHEKVESCSYGTKIKLLIRGEVYIIKRVGRGSCNERGKQEDGRISNSQSSGFYCNRFKSSFSCNCHILSSSIMFTPLPTETLLPAPSGLERFCVSIRRQKRLAKRLLCRDDS